MTRRDLADGLAIFLVLGFLIFGFPWVIVAVSHFAGDF